MASWSFAISPDTIASTPIAGRAEVEDAISRICSDATRDVLEPVRSAVNYALTGGGKRLRGMLLLSAYRAAGGHGDAD